jgi:large conductance mechanosensitive channel
MPTDQSYLAWKVTVDGKDIPYGLLLGDVVNFVIVAFALFLFVVKFIGWLTRARAKQEAVTAAAIPPLSKDQELLTEIRDLLAKR